MGIAKIIKSRIVVSEYNAGTTIKELSKKYGLTTATIRNYIRDDKEMRKNKRAAEKKAAEQKKMKAVRDKERRNTLEARSALAEKRKEKVRADVKSGMSMREAAEKEGLSYGTVTDYIRGDKLPNIVESYRDLFCAAVEESTMRQWAKKQIGRYIRTPDGEMIVLQTYPHIIECARRCKKEFVVTTYTHSEVFYLNQKEA